MALTNDEISKMTAVDPMFEWVHLPRFDHSLNKSIRLTALQVLATLKSAGIEYATIPCSEVVMVRKWTEIAMLAYHESMMTDICPIADFVVAFRESM